ncbi:MAG: hypothetical protein HUJ60_02000, partial [Bacilli bacterium]|nr:hypothetical protein [Bacilli bacterium]
FSRFQGKRRIFKEYWETKFAPVSKARIEAGGGVFTDVWDKIEDGIRQAIDWKTSDSVKLVVGSSDADCLDYASTEHGIYVVVGGQKLSRGLTLDGLSVSYYLRDTKNVDTLLQMGRWFGYRKGWLDVCRVFTTKQSALDYLEATIVTESFKQQVAEMNARHASPRSFGLNIKSTARLLPTAKNKARGAVRRQISYSGSLSQMLEFDKQSGKRNLDLTEKFIANLMDSGKKVVRAKVRDAVFAGVKCDDVLGFLSKFACPDDTLVSWRDYILACQKANELTDWTIIVSSNMETDDSSSIKISGLDVYKPKRVLRLGGLSSGTLKLRVLSRPSTYLGFFPDSVDTVSIQGGYNPDKDPEGVIRNHFTEKHGILGIYVFDPTYRKDGKMPMPSGKKPGDVVADCENTIGLAVWFPSSRVYNVEYVYANPVEAERLEREKAAMSEDKEQTA